MHIYFNLSSCFVFFQKNLREAEDLVDDGVRDKSRLSIAVEDGLDKVKVEAFLDYYPLDSYFIYDYCILLALLIDTVLVVCCRNLTRKLMIIKDSLQKRTRLYKL